MTRLAAALLLVGCGTAPTITASAPDEIPPAVSFLDHPDPRAPLPCLRHWESTDRYDVEADNGHSGAYQFDQRTWDGVVERLGLTGWIGRRPASAPFYVQDVAAWQLYLERGLQPWAVGWRCR